MGFFLKEKSDLKVFYYISFSVFDQHSVPACSGSLDAALKDKCLKDDPPANHINFVILGSLW